MNYYAIMLCNMILIYAVILTIIEIAKQLTPPNQRTFELIFNWVKCFGGLYCGWLVATHFLINAWTLGAIVFFCLAICKNSFVHWYKSTHGEPIYDYVANLRFHLDVIVLWYGFILVSQICP